MEAMRLVRTLDATELQILRALVRGMSLKSTATMMGIPLDRIEHARATMMKKLKAARTADVVRIGLYAGLDLQD